MAATTKAKARNLHERKPDALALPRELLDDDVSRDATLASSVRLRGAITSRAYAVSMFGQGVDLSTYARLLREQSEEVRNGDLSRIESMLVTQANTLDMIFNQFAHKAAHCEYLNQMQAHLSFALKAQAQCRATVEALAEIKNPRPVAFVKQANIAHGPQQVNNGIDGATANGTAPPEPRARGKKLEPANELLAHDNGETTLDGGAAGEAGRSDKALETVGKINGTGE
ncbi:hypothetical protein WN982_14165 [Paraburkholderia sp. IMGN_8]|uniref:hypothetical protein n=1 Tax=Paraburkholderia sp. IMGN_8 TaxID=3136564 RepID=UPI003100DBFD